MHSIDGRKPSGGGGSVRAAARQLGADGRWWGMDDGSHGGARLRPRLSARCSTGQSKKQKTAPSTITNTTTTFEMLSFSSSESSSKANNSFNAGASWSQQGGASVNVGYTRTW
jgi:hypothetical protein